MGFAYGPGQDTGPLGPRWTAAGIGRAHGGREPAAAVAPWLRGCSSPWRRCEARGDGLKARASYTWCSEADARVGENSKRPGRRVRAVGRLGGGCTTSARTYMRNEGRERAGGGPANSSACSQPHGGLRLGRDAASAEIDGCGSKLGDGG